MVFPTGTLIRVSYNIVRIVLLLVDCCPAHSPPAASAQNHHPWCWNDDLVSAILLFAICWLLIVVCCDALLTIRLIAMVVPNEKRLFFLCYFEYCTKQPRRRGQTSEKKPGWRKCLWRIQISVEQRIPKINLVEPQILLCKVWSSLLSSVSKACHTSTFALCLL